MMRCLLGEILKINVEKIQFLNTELKVKNVRERRKIVDCLLKVNDNIYIHLEINSRKDETIALRNLIYFYHFVSTKTMRNEEYDKNNQFMHIDFSYGLANSKEVEEEYKERNKTAKIEYVDCIKLIEFNMDKIVKFWYDENEKEIDKNKYLIMLNLEKEELEKLSKKFEGDELIMEYKEKCEKLNEDEYFTSFLSYEDDQRFLKNSYISEGEKKGSKNAKNEIARSMLKDGFTVEQVSKYTKLPKSSILSL